MSSSLRLSDMHNPLPSGNIQLKERQVRRDVEGRIYHGKMAASDHSRQSLLGLSLASNIHVGAPLHFQFACSAFYVSDNPPNLLQIHRISNWDFTKEIGHLSILNFSFPKYCHFPTVERRGHTQRHRHTQPPFG